MKLIHYFFSLLLFSLASIPLSSMKNTDQRDDGKEDISEEDNKKRDREGNNDVIEEESELKKIKLPELPVDYSDFECQKHKEHHDYLNIPFELLSEGEASEKKCPWCYFGSTKNLEEFQNLEQEAKDKNLFYLGSFFGVAIDCHKIEDLQKMIGLIKFLKGDLKTFLNGMIDCACKSGSLEIIKLFVTNDCDINYCDSDDGLTPLILSIKSQIKNSEIVKYLIENGANIFAQDKSGRNAHWWAHAEEAISTLDEAKCFPVPKNFKPNPNSQAALIQRLFTHGGPYLFFYHLNNIGRCLNRDNEKPIMNFLICMKIQNLFPKVPKGIQALIVKFFAQMHCLKELAKKMNIGAKKIRYWLSDDFFIDIEINAELRY